MLRQTQKDKILAMLRTSSTREVNCLSLAKAYLYHKAATRISELKKLGYDIRYIPGDVPMDGKYRLVFDPDYDRAEIKFDGNQRIFA